MKWGKHEKFLSARATKGKKTPAIEEMPVLYEYLDDVWQAFMSLNQSRQAGFGPCALSVCDITAWMELYDIDDRQWFFELIQAMDNEWLKWVNKERTKEEKNRGNSKDGHRRKKSHTNG